MPLTQTTFFGRPAWQLANEHLSLTVVPQFSARVMALTREGQNCLWANEPLLRGEIGGDETFGNWLNWGGYKTWLAPQSRWPNPLAPSDELDNVAWVITAQSETALELAGPAISWGGVRLKRRLALAAGEPRVRVTETMQNDGETAQTWSVWAVAQFPVPGWATYPPDGSRRTLVGSAPQFEGDRLRLQGDAKWKVGAFTRAGWGTYQADDWPRSFRANFPAHFHLPHPDRCTLETWSNSGPGYTELEWLGPLVRMEPGQRWEFETEWVIE